MSKRSDYKSKWTFAKEVKSARIALRKNDKLSQHQLLLASNLNEDSPQFSCSLLATTIGITRRCEALHLLDSGEKDLAWRRIHIVWRYKAFSKIVYADRLFQLAEEVPSNRRLPIGDIENQGLTDHLMTMALSAIFHEEEAADRIGQYCLRFATEPLRFVRDETLTLGPVAPFLLKLYCLWRGIDFELSEYGLQLLEPFHTILEAWNDPELIQEAVCKLTDIHAWKSVNVLSADNDLIFGLQSGIHKELPTEILFIQKIRNDLGLSVPKIDHPLLQSPIAQIPNPMPTSGYDPFLAEVYELCRKEMPNLQIPWEEKYQQLGPSDPKALPMTDMEV